MKKILLFLLAMAVVMTIVVRLRYGGGDPYPDLTGTPLLGDAALEEVFNYPEPIGNVAVSGGGRIFFTVHPESRPQGNKLLQLVDGAAEPFPDGASQQRLFDTVLGLAIDRQQRLWTIDHGNHGMRTARLLAFDIETGAILYDRKLDRTIAPAGSFLQDLQVSADGRTVIIADASFWRKSPAIIVYDVNTATVRRVLDGHPLVSAENYRIQNHGRDMVFAAGLVALRGGVDGIALGDEWLYFAPISGAAIYRVLLEDLRNADLPDTQLAARVERFADKPLSDGLSLDRQDTVFVTDVEHGAILAVGTDGTLQTMIKSRRMRWPDGLSFGPDGWLYVADSALADVVLKPRDHIRASGPYRIFRFQPGSEGNPGQ